MTLSSNDNTVFLLGLATTAAVEVSEVLTRACVVMSVTDDWGLVFIFIAVSVPSKEAILIEGILTVPES